MFQLIVFSLQELWKNNGFIIQITKKSYFSSRKERRKTHTKKRFHPFFSIRDRDKSKREERGRKEPRKININYKIIKKREKIQFEALRCKRKNFEEFYIIHFSEPVSDESKNR